MISSLQTVLEFWSWKIRPGKLVPRETSCIGKVDQRLHWHWITRVLYVTIWPICLLHSYLSFLTGVWDQIPIHQVRLADVHCHDYRPARPRHSYVSVSSYSWSFLSLSWWNQRLSLDRARYLYLNNYYDPFHPELHLYVFKPDTSFRLSHMDTPSTSWSMVLLQSGTRVWHTSLHFFRDLQLYIGQLWSGGVQQTAVWAPTWDLSFRFWFFCIALVWVTSSMVMAYVQYVVIYVDILIGWRSRFLAGEWSPSKIRRSSKERCQVLMTAWRTQK